MKIQLHVGTKADLSFNLRHFWPMKSFRWPRFYRKTDWHFKISDAVQCACMCNSFSYDDLYCFFSLMIKWYQFKKLSAPRSSKKLVWWWYYDAVFPNRIRLMNLKFFTACLIHNSTPASDTLSSMFLKKDVSQSLIINLHEVHIHNRQLSKDCCIKNYQNSWEEIINKRLFHSFQTFSIKKQ